MLAIIQNYSGMLWAALGKTLLLTLLSLLFAMVIGMIFALMNVSKSRVLNCIGTVYVDAVRGVPLIVLAYFIYFGLPFFGSARRYHSACHELRCIYGGNYPCRYPERG